MTTKTLHILNGDSTRFMIKQTSIEGNLCVWSDVLSDGPTHPEVGSDAYWDVRTTYMSSAFEVSAEDFRNKAMAEFEKIRAFASYHEVVLWFEHDLFCQINMFALLHWFNQQDRGQTKISLICVGHEAGYDKLVALGEMTPEEFPGLLARRRVMGTQDFVFASDIYEAWCSEDPTDLETYTLLPSNEFPYLANAINSHFRRFPSKQTGLTEIEAKIIKLINSGIHQKRKIVENLLRWQTHQGFGDLQYFLILERLSPLFSGEEEVHLRPEFKEIFNRKEPVSTIDRNYYLGGAMAQEWRWNEQKNELVSSED